MVLIHGFGGGTFSWRLVMAPLAARAGCRVIALDRPGFGCGARCRVLACAAPCTGLAGVTAPALWSSKSAKAKSLKP